jgi:hypothetical protein
MQIECYTNMEQSLQGQDLVLSCEDPGPRGQLHNAAMASVAGHPIWLSALQLAMQRSPAGIAESSSWVMRQGLHLWQQTPLYNGMLEVLRTTGPLLLTDVYRVRSDAVHLRTCCSCSKHKDLAVMLSCSLVGWFFKHHA